jgi:hypothetical protein
MSIEKTTNRVDNDKSDIDIVPSMVIWNGWVNEKMIND